MRLRWLSIAALAALAACRPAEAPVSVADAPPLARAHEHATLVRFR